MAMYPQQLKRGKATLIEPDNHLQFEVTIWQPDVLSLPLAAVEAASLVPEFSGQACSDLKAH